MTAAGTGRTAADAPWDISFLRPGVLVTAGVTLVTAPVVGLVAGWPSALGVLGGAAVVTAFFCVSAVVIAWAGRIDDALTLPAALGTFLVKALVFFAVLSAMPADAWIDRLALAWTVVAGALLWSGVQARWVWTRQLYYVAPPAPPAASLQNPRPDPEKPTTRG